MTLLAFGNGAPDVFSALSAVVNMKNDDVGLLMGAVLGISCMLLSLVYYYYCYSRLMACFPVRSRKAGP